MKVILALLILVLFLAAPPEGFAKDFETRFDVGAGPWIVELGSEFKVTESGIAGTEIDLVEDLGMDEEEVLPNIKVSLRLWDRHKLSVSYFGCDFSGSKTITRQIDYKGASYTANTPVSSELSLDITEGRYSYSFIRNENLELAGFAGIKFAHIEATLEAAGFPTRTADFDAPIPVIGAEGEFCLPNKFSISGEFGGLSVSAGDYDFSLVDATAVLNYDFNKNWRASVGYRYFDVEAEDDGGDDRADFNLQGPVLMLTGSF